MHYIKYCTRIAPQLDANYTSNVLKHDISHKNSSCIVPKLDYICTMITDTT